MHFIPRVLLLLPVLMFPFDAADAVGGLPKNDSTNTGSEYEVGVGGTPVSTAHAAMMSLSAGYGWNWRRLHLKGNLTYRQTLSARSGIAETDTRLALMAGLHRYIRNRRLAVSTGGGAISGGRYSGISLFGEIPLLDRYIGIGIPLELKASLFQFGAARLGVSVIGFVQVVSIVGEQKGSAVTVSVKGSVSDLF